MFMDSGAQTVVHVPQVELEVPRAGKQDDWKFLQYHRNLQKFGCGKLTNKLGFIVIKLTQI